MEKLKEIHTATHPARAEREGDKKKRPKKKSS
jgi:hypothetical protein